jgi:leucyl-tRNA synthetase
MLLICCRYTIFSPKDGQPCMDHDRSTGEVSSYVVHVDFEVVWTTLLRPVIKIVEIQGC